MRAHSLTHSNTSQHTHTYIYIPSVHRNINAPLRIWVCTCMLKWTNFRRRLRHCRQGRKSISHLKSIRGTLSLKNYSSRHRYCSWHPSIFSSSIGPITLLNSGYWSIVALFNRLPCSNIMSGLQYTVMRSMYLLQLCVAAAINNLYCACSIETNKTKVEGFMLHVYYSPSNWLIPYVLSQTGRRRRRHG